MTSKSKSTKRILQICVAIILLVVIYLFLFGPLFPFSPVKPGFAKTTFTRYNIIYPKNTIIPSEYYVLDSLLSDTEAFHKLLFTKKIKILLCATTWQHKRISLSGGHANTALTGTIIFINPSIYHALYPPEIELDKGNIFFSKGRGNIKRDVVSFLKHEFSHAILYQNTTFWKARKIKSWLEEGLAIYFANLHHYYRGSELKKLAIDRGYFFNLLDDKAHPAFVPLEIKYYFQYGLYGAFMEYLINNYGLEPILNYTKDYLKNPDKENELFVSYFGISPEAALEHFRQSLSAL